VSETRVTGQELYNENRAGASYTALGKKYGLTKGQVARLIANYRGARGADAAAESTRDDLVKLETTRTNQNNIEVTATGAKRIITLEDLVERAKIDLTVWSIPQWKANAWEVTTGEGTTYTNHQVKANLVALRPHPIEPVVSPIQFATPRPTKPHPRQGNGICRVLIWTDPHFGFRFTRGQLIPLHDRAVLNILAQIMEFEKIEASINLGDILDNADWSDKFIRSPDFYFTTQPAIIEAAYWLRKLKTSHAIEGNHDNRMPQAMLTHAQQAYGLRSYDDLKGYSLDSLPKYLDFEGAGIEWHAGYPDADYWPNDGVRLTHGEYSTENADQDYLKKNQVSVIFGHLHKSMRKMRTIWERDKQRTIKAYSVACAARVDGVVPGVKEQQNWQQGGGVLEYDPQGTWFKFTPIEIENGAAYHAGHWFDGNADADQQVKQMIMDTVGVPA